jgi:hypothetical protein
MRARIVIAGVLAGLVVFLWGGVSHMALPLGEVGISPLPDQERLLPVLGEAMKEQRIYVFPFDENQENWAGLYQRHPHGILALTPAGAPFSFGALLAWEATSNVLSGILAAFLYAAIVPAGWGRTLAFGVTLGGFVSLAVDFSYWNWYGFPTAYLAAQMIEQVVGWSLAALVLGWRLGKG